MIVVLVFGAEDWAGLYLDGKLAMESHSLHITQVLKALVGQTIDHVTIIEVRQDWLDGVGSLPTKLSDISAKVRL